MDPTKKIQKNLLNEINKRIKDYDQQDFTAQRDKLIELWKKHHPAGASEPVSLKHHTLLQIEKGVIDNYERPEVWVNDIYQVVARHWTKDQVFGTDGGMISIGIHTLDGMARHDWREFQNIKNQIAGPECEGFELYPAESRLVDPSNYYTIWCFPGLKRIRVGLNERRVLDSNEALAPQRGFEK